MPGKPIPIRLDDDILLRLEELRAVMAERAGGVDITKATALRAVIASGLSKLESEFGISYGAKPKPKPKRK